MNTVYERTAIQHCWKLKHSIGGSCAKEIKLFYFLPNRSLPHGPHKIWSGISQTFFFFNYVIWIV
jgi:hypothetical protein